MDALQRPTSPHLQIYKLPLTALLSVSHRGTGVALAGGGVLLCYWLLALANGPEAFAGANALMGSWFGRAVLFSFSFALFFHLGNGIRHLFWDAGLGFELDIAEKSSWWVLWGSAALTALAWIVVAVIRS